MSEPSSFNISLTPHQSYQVSPRFRLDKISQGRGEKKKKEKGSAPAAGFGCSVKRASSCRSCSLTKTLFYQEVEPRFIQQQPRFNSLHERSHKHTRILSHRSVTVPQEQKVCVLENENLKNTLNFFSRNKSHTKLFHDIK